MDLLETGRPGGAVLEIPQRVLVGPAERSGERPTRPKHAAVDARCLDEAASLLSKAERPVIVAGRPVVAAGAEAALRQLAEKLQAPVFADRNAKGALAEDHPLALGFTWSPTTVAEDLLREADVVLAIGPREHAATGTRSPEQIGQQLIHLDWDAAQQDDGPPARLKLAGPRRRRPVRPGRAGHGAPGSRPSRPEPLDAVREGPWRYAEGRVPWALDFFRELQAALPQDVLFFTDSLVGLWIFRLLKAYQGRSYRFGWGNGSGHARLRLPRRHRRQAGRAEPRGRLHRRRRRRPLQPAGACHDAALRDEGDLHRLQRQLLRRRPRQPHRELRRDGRPRAGEPGLREAGRGIRDARHPHRHAGRHRHGAARGAGRRPLDADRGAAGATPGRY